MQELETRLYTLIYPFEHPPELTTTIRTLTFHWSSVYWYDTEIKTFLRFLFPIITKSIAVKILSSITPSLRPVPPPLRSGISIQKVQVSSVSKT